MHRWDTVYSKSLIELYVVSISAPSICTSDVTSVGVFTCCSDESIELEKYIPTQYRYF